MATLITIDEIDNFKEIKSVSPETIANSYIETIRGLDEREELEPFIRSILFDINDTPHGPAELVDIFTHRITVGGINGMAGLIIKGKSFKKVKPSDVSHQINRKRVKSPYSIFVMTLLLLLMDNGELTPILSGAGLVAATVPRRMMTPFTVLMQ